MHVSPSHRAKIQVLGLLIGLIMGASGDAAQAQARLRAHFTISMTGVSIGQIVWLVSIGEQCYTASATGKASGVLSVLVNGEGAIDARGNVVDGRLVPKLVTSKIIDDEGNSELRMSFDDGVAREQISHESSARPDRVPVTDADRRGVADPLTAMLMTVGGEVFTPANCNHVLSVFDGRRRYDLELSFKRVDRITIERGYSGFVLVCGVMLKPIAGYRADSMLVKYVAGRRDMELWFALIAGTPNVAPIRVTIPTLLGTLEILADQFDVLAPQAPTPSTAPASTTPR